MALSKQTPPLLLFPESSLPVMMRHLSVQYTLLKLSNSALFVACCMSYKKLQNKLLYDWLCFYSDTAFCYSLPDSNYCNCKQTFIKIDSILTFSNLTFYQFCVPVVRNFVHKSYNVCPQMSQLVGPSVYFVC